MGAGCGEAMHSWVVGGRGALQALSGKRAPAPETQMAVRLVVLAEHVDQADAIHSATEQGPVKQARSRVGGGRAAQADSSASAPPAMHAAPRNCRPPPHDDEQVPHSLSSLQHRAGRAYFDGHNEPGPVQRQGWRRGAGRLLPHSAMRGNTHQCGRPQLPASQGTAGWVALQACAG